MWSRRKVRLCNITNTLYEFDFLFLNFVCVRIFFMLIAKVFGSPTKSRKTKSRMDSVQFGILSIQDFAQFGILSILDFVQFGILYF